MDAGQLDQDHVWAYGPDSTGADQQAHDFAGSIDRELARGNPSERTMEITPDGKQKGTYKVYVYPLKPKQA